MDDDEAASGTDSQKKKLKIKLCDYDLKAYGLKKCLVTSLDGSSTFFDGKTKDDGNIEFDIPSEPSAKITVYLSDEPDAESREWEIKIADDFPPVSTIRGLLTRLKNLGYYTKEPRDEWGEEEQYALQWFQNDYQLSNTERSNNETEAKLAEVYGS